MFFVVTPLSGDIRRTDRDPAWQPAIDSHSIILQDTHARFLYVYTPLSVHHTLQSTYIYRVQSSVWRLQNYCIDPPPPLHPENVSSPRTKGGGVHTRRAVRGRGINISEDARRWIGLYLKKNLIIFFDFGPNFDIRKFSRWLSICGSCVLMKAS